MFSIIISILIVVFILLVGVILRIIHGSWLAPSAFYSLWWGTTTLISIFAGSNETVPISGLLWILISCLVVGIGSLLFIPTNNLEKGIFPVNNDDVYKQNRFLIKLYIFSLTISFSYIIFSVLYNEVNLNDFGSIEGLLILAAKFSKDRYEENTVLPMYIKLQLPFVFFSSSLSGALFSMKKKWYYLLSFIPPIIISLLFTEKAGIFFCISAWVASLLSLKAFTINLKIFDLKTIANLFFAIIILTIILFTSAFARLGSIDINEFEVVIEKLYSTLFGHIAAFSNWFENNNFVELNSAGGRFTFSGVFDFFGFSKRESGLYTENFQLSNGALTNLYSIHKGLLLDFSIIGTLMIYFLFGLFGAYTYKSVIKLRKEFIGILAIIYLVIIVSIFYSIFIFNTTLLSSIFTILIFFKLKIKSSN